MRPRLFLIPVLLCTIFATTASAQIIINNTLTPQQLVEDVLLGEGVVATNITFTGNAQQIGTFNAMNGNFLLEEGVVMSTGSVLDVPGPANNFASTGFGQASDPDLNIISGGVTRDAVVLEFDFVAIGDTVAFSYVFASEEYPNFCCGTFNDVFAFLISGPGFNGPYSNNAVNIALLPGTNTPVSISNVNNGPANNGPCTNCQYYVDNSGGGANGVVFNAHTTSLTAIAPMQCGETYHIKLAIADVADNIYDSGVFLEARSFTSSPIEIVIDNSVSELFDVPTVVEDCIGADITFTRPTAEDSLEVVIVYGGTAVNGVNYTGLPDTLVFPPGVSELTYFLQALDDGVVQTENLTIILSYESTTVCGFVIESEVTIEIMDNNYPFDVVLESEFVGCGGQYGYYAVTASASNGIPNYHYSWSNGEQGAEINFAPEVETTYTLTVTDSCSMVQQTVDITIPATSAAPAPTISTSNDATLWCPGDVATLTAHGQGGITPYTYSWSNGMSGSQIVVQPTQTTDYVIEMTDACYAGIIRDTITVTVFDYVPPSMSLQDYTVTCPGHDQLVEVVLENGLEPFDVVWSNGMGGESNILNPVEDETIGITATDACGTEAQGEVNLTVAQYAPLYVLIGNSDTLGLDSVSVCELWADTLWVVTTGGLAPYTYSWQGTQLSMISTGGDSVEIRVPFELPADSSVVEYYSVTVTDQCGVDTTVQTLVSLISCDIVQPGIFNPNSTHMGTTDFCGSRPQNNVFALPCLELYPGNRMTIFDRWGRKVYEAENYHLKPWDGGKNTHGVYFYVLEVPGREDRIQGYMHLVN